MTRDRANQVAFIVYILVWFLIFAGSMLAALLLAACAHHVPGDPFELARPSEMHAVCLRLVDVDGNVYERPAWFNDEGYKHALRFPGARAGLCEQLKPRAVPEGEVKPEEKKPCGSRRCNPNG